MKSNINTAMIVKISCALFFETANIFRIYAQWQLCQVFINFEDFANMHMISILHDY